MPYFAAAGLAISAYSAYSSAGAGEEQAEAAQRAYELETELKLGAVKANVEDIKARKEEEEDATADRMAEITRQSLINRGRMAAAMGDSGVAGSSVSGLHMAAYLEEARARGHEIKNFQSKSKQLNRDIRAAKMGLQTGTRPGAYDSTSDWLGFASKALSIGANTDWSSFRSTTTTTP